jgi:hypothetical protein
MAAYGSEKRQKRERFAAVMAGLQDYTAAELDQELPELLNTLKVLDFEFSSIDKLLERLRQVQT